MNSSDTERLIKRLYSRKKSSAKRRGLKFSLSLDLFDHLVQDNCDYCGADPSNTLKYNGFEFNYSGLDRLDQSFGYEPENVVPCCRFCNSLRGSMPLATWIDFLRGVSHWGTSWPRWTEIGIDPDPDRPTKSYYAHSHPRNRKKRGER